ncbi:MAG: helix-turn-helix transcriptional regulator [Saprospiraceae bacterium]|nr:helix-turn-helix transcriptional regulator [Saprospiraceae bacterium]
MEILEKGNYFGKRNTQCSLDGILLSKYEYTVDRTAWHFHENPYFMFVLYGNMVDGNAKIETPCPAGSLMFTNWEEAHYGAKHSDKAGGFHLEFERNWFEKNQISLEIPEGSTRVYHPHIHVLFARLYHEFMLFDDSSRVAIELILLQVADALSAKAQVEEVRAPKWIAQLKELLHHDPSDLSLRYLSEQLGVHPVHISRSVPKYLGASLGEYLRKMKLSRAIPLLFDSDKSLTQIAYQAGFSDQSHFNLVFKSHFGINPSTFRRSLEGGEKG